MKWFGIVRVLIRIARAIERGNELEARRLELEFPPLGDPPAPKKAIFSRPTIAQWNEERLARKLAQR